MSERERWIVYPLLLLILGIALRDKFGAVKEVRAQRLICEKLVVLNDDAGPQVVLDSTAAGGTVRAINADHTVALILGYENHQSNVFREWSTADGVATRSMLGNLRPASGQPDSSNPKWPLLDPRLHHGGESPAKADGAAADAGAQKPAK